MNQRLDTVRLRVMQIHRQMELDGVRISAQAIINMVHKIMEKEITVERLAHVRDTFIFATFTGLAFSDLKGLKLEHLAVDNNGSVWIRKKRQTYNILFIS